MNNKLFWILSVCIPLIGCSATREQPDEFPAVTAYQQNQLERAASRQKAGYEQVADSPYAVPYFDALKQFPAFRQAVKSALGNLSRKYPWINRNVAAQPGEVLQHQAMGELVVYFVCRPHYCNTQQLKIVYQPQSEKAWYQVVEDGEVMSMSEDIPPIVQWLFAN